jgi:hypothetical protein
VLPGVRSCLDLSENNTGRAPIAALSVPPSFTLKFRARVVATTWSVLLCAYYTGGGRFGLGARKN